MHTFQAKNGTLFHFNSDLSGEVIVTRPKPMSNSTCVRLLPVITFEDKVEINGDDILSFVADYIRRQRISDLEQADDAVVLGGGVLSKTDRPPKPTIRRT